MSSLIQRSFSGGELAPALYARVDTSKYATGTRTMRNFILLKHGGAANRPGTEFIAEVKDSSKGVRLIPFIFNVSQTYVLEFGDQYMRVYKEGAQLTDLTLTITGISNANPAVVTYTGTDPSNGQEVQIESVVGAIGQYLNGRNFKIANVNGGANTFELQYLDGTNVNSTSFGAYGSGGTAKRVYTISTPYLEADLMALKVVQSADVVTIVHPDYAPRELSRTGDTSWTLSTITFAPSISAPTGQSATQNGTTGSTTYNYKITAVASETFEESLASSAATVANGNATLTPTNNISITWSAVTGAQEYNVYKEINGVYGFIGVAGSTSFVDIGYTADSTDTPPTARNPFNAAGDYPSCVAYIQQRLMFANTDNNPETCYASRTGQFKNFTTSSPQQDDDAVTFSLAGRQVNTIRNLLDLGRLIVFTESGEWAIQGDADGVIKPAEINPKQYSYNGSNDLDPIVVGGNALYVQARGSIVRDLGFDYQVDGYRGNDLTIFSTHLFDGYNLVDWTYQQIPNSIVWAVRDDGVLLGLTYMREQEMLGWHRHDFGTDICENVCVIPEGTEDVLYVVVRRTINGATKRYIEKLSTRMISDIVDAKFMDSSLSYDGRHTGSTTMTLSGGTTWAYDETITITASSSTFASTDVGNAIQLTGADGTLIRFDLTGYTSATVMTGRPDKTVPASMRSVAIATWAMAVDEISGLWHLEGKNVSIFADGFVLGSPNNEQNTIFTVTNGRVTLDNRYSVIHIGLPYISDLQTLDIDTPQGETISDKSKNVSRVSIFMEKSRGAWVGASPPSDDSVDPLEGLTELKLRETESMDEPIALQTNTKSVNIRPEWNSNGRIFVRQVDPIPLTILAVVPAGKFPFTGG